MLSMDNQSTYDKDLRMDQNLKLITDWRSRLEDVDQKNFMDNTQLKQWQDDKIDLACDAAMSYKVTPKSPRRIWKPKVYKVPKLFWTNKGGNQN